MKARLAVGQVSHQREKRHDGSHAVLTIQHSQEKSGVLFDDLYALIVSAVCTDLVRSFQLAALSAFGESGHIQLPNVGTPLIASGSGHLRFWNSHCGTSFLYRRTPAMGRERPRGIIGKRITPANPEEPPVWDPLHLRRIRSKHGSDSHRTGDKALCSPPPDRRAAYKAG